MGCHRLLTTNLDSVLKSIEITLLTKVQSKLWFFQYSCMDVRVEPLGRLSAEEIDAFELWRRPLRVLWTSMRSNQSILKEINLEYAKAPILWAPDVKSQLTGKTLILGKIEGKGETETEDKMVGWRH